MSAAVIAPPVRFGNIVANNVSFDVVGTHTYPEESTGLPTFSVTVTDHASSTGTQTGTATVLDQQITTPVIVNLPTRAVEDAALPAITGLAIFTDPAGLGMEPVSPPDFVATINWGDGDTNDPATVVSLGNGLYRVDSATHTYADGGTMTVIVTVKHDLLSAVPSGSQTIAVADAPLTAGTLTPPVGALEGLVFSNTVFDFTDANPGATAADFTATVTPGDGTGPFTLTNTPNAANGQIVKNNNGGFDVQFSHTYAEELSNQTFAVQVSDDGSTTGASSSTFSVADQQITGLTVNSSSLPANGVEDASTGPITNIATFTDPAGVGVETTSPPDFVVTIGWGDATTSVGSVTSQVNGVYQVNAPAHTYGEEGAYPIVVTVQHDAEPAVSALGNSTFNVGEEGLPFTDTFSGVKGAPINASNWTTAQGTLSLIAGGGQAIGTASSNTAFYSQTLAGDVSLTATVGVHTTTGLPLGQPGGTTGLVARAGGTGPTASYYYGAVTDTGDRNLTAEIIRVENGTTTQLVTQVDTGISINSQVSLRFDVVGTSLKLFVNGNLTVSASDTVLTHEGLVGFEMTAFGQIGAFTASSVPPVVAFSDTFAGTPGTAISTTNYQVTPSGAFTITTDGSHQALGNQAANTALYSQTLTEDVNLTATIGVPALSRPPGQPPQPGQAGLLARVGLDLQGLIILPRDVDVLLRGADRREWAADGPNLPRGERRSAGGTGQPRCDDGGRQHSSHLAVRRQRRLAKTVRQRHPRRRGHGHRPDGRRPGRLHGHLRQPGRSVHDRARDQPGAALHRHVLLGSVVEQLPVARGSLHPVKQRAGTRQQPVRRHPQSVGQFRPLPEECGRRRDRQRDARCAHRQRAGRATGPCFRHRHWTAFFVLLRRSGRRKRSADGPDLPRGERRHPGAARQPRDRDQLRP